MNPRNAKHRPMYDSAGIDLVALAQELAAPAILAERERYAPLLAEVEQYAAERGLPVGGPAGAGLLLQTPADPATSYLYALYSERPWEDSKEIAKRLYASAPEGLGEYAAAFGGPAQDSARVFADTRLLVELRLLRGARGASALQAVGPELAPARFAPGEVQCLPSELQLVDVYRTLGSPQRVGEWGAALRQERALAAQVWATLGAKIDRAVEGGESRAEAARAARRLCERIAASPGRLVVGPRALGGCAAAARLQAVSGAGAEADRGFVAGLAAETPGGLQVSQVSLNIPTDPRAERLTVSSQRPDGSSASVLDIFTAGAYDLIPYTLDAASGERRATHFALLRFRYTDLWTVRLLLRMKVLEPEAAAKLLGGVRDDVQAIRDGYVALARRGAAAAPEVFPLPPGDGGGGDAGGADGPTGGYIGQYDSDRVAARRRQRAAAKSSKRYWWFPGKYPGQRRGPGKK